MKVFVVLLVLVAAAYCYTDSGSDEPDSAAEWGRKWLKNAKEKARKKFEEAKKRIAEAKEKARKKLEEARKLKEKIKKKIEEARKLLEEKKKQAQAKLEQARKLKEKIKKKIEEKRKWLEKKIKHYTTTSSNHGKKVSRTVKYVASSTTLTYPGIWGRWGSWQYCNGGFAVAFSQRVEKKQGGGDDTALNGICLHCSDGKSVCSSVGPWGGWVKSGACSAGFNGANFKFEPKQGGGDDTAANEVLLVCSSGGNFHTSNRGGWGRWLGYKRCASNQRICGIRTRVEPNQGKGDDTALNGVELKCCDKKIV